MSVEQAVILLQTNPGLQGVVRERLRQSGLTRDQIHQRLQDAGYSPTLLDPYITDTAPASSAPATAETVQAINLLGVDAFPPELVQQADSVLAHMKADSLHQAALRTLSDTTGPLRLFGFDVLRTNTTQFQQVAGPVDDTYRLGPGDQLVLLLTGAVENSAQMEVTTQGFVVIPKVGQIYVNSLTLGQFRNLLYNRLGQVYSGISRAPDARTQFEITVAKVRIQSVRVIGEVAKPGLYSVAATGGVLNAVYTAGGLTARGNFRAVEVRRGTTLVATVDLYEYLERGVISNDVQLSPGDVLRVPVHGPRVRIAGEVMRPAIYEIKPGETLRDAIRLAGGLTPYAEVDRATIDRVLPAAERPEAGYMHTVLTSSLRQVTDSTVAPTALVAEDSVTVFRARGGRRASATIAGNVWQPATYALAPGMRLWDLIRVAGGLRPDTYGGRVQVIRIAPDSTRRLLGFVLDSAAGAGSANNPALQESDQVTVYRQNDFRPQRYVTVYGAVQRPGVVAFADSMTLRDAILQAGGLRENAWLGEAEVSRLRERQTDTGDSLAVILQVRLDSSYVVDSTSYVRRPTRPGGEISAVLHPYDNVFVRSQPGWELQRNVSVGGEVQFPGRYTLTTKDERVASILQRAGGLTPNAYPAGFQLIRRSGTGHIAVDLERVLRDPRYKDNLVLAAGDSLYLPAFLPTVLVEGAVNSPTSVTYVPNAGLDYYVSAAGGFGPQADKSRTFVRQPNGLVRKGGKPMPGATVTVPRRDPGERRWLIEMIPFFTAAIQVVTAAATLILAARN